MTGSKLVTPVVFLIFNRPETTEHVFQTIRQAKPRQFLIVADGPRESVLGEIERCLRARAVIDRVDWTCEILKNYSDVNLGCRRRVSSGLDWVFQTVEEAIILEADCLPDPSFFTFCEVLLEKYREDDRVAQNSGDNFQFGRKRTPYSYYVSRYAHIWGWASWRRSWRRYDAGMGLWPAFRYGGWLVDWLGDERVASYWEGIFVRVYREEIDTWDYQLVFSSWVQGALTILPSENLVSNIGFGAGGTHVGGESPFANMAMGRVTFPLVHPELLICDAVADAMTEETMFASLRKERKVSGGLFRGIRRFLRPT